MSKQAADPAVGTLVNMDAIVLAARRGLLPGMLGTEPDARSAAPVEAPLALPPWALRRIAQGAPRRLASGEAGFLSFEDFCWLALAERDAMAGPSIEYWCAVLDQDDDGRVGHQDVHCAIRTQQEAPGGITSPKSVKSRDTHLAPRAPIDEEDMAGDSVAVPTDAALTQLIDAIRPDSYVAVPQGRGTISFTARTVRSQACGPVIYGLLLALSSSPSSPERHPKES